MISEMLQKPCLVGEEATKDEVLRRIQDMSLVHIAAHGDADRGERSLQLKEWLGSPVHFWCPVPVQF